METQTVPTARCNMHVRPLPNGFNAPTPCTTPPCTDYKAPKPALPGRSKQPIIMHSSNRQAPIVSSSGTNQPHPPNSDKIHLGNSISALTSELSLSNLVMLLLLRPVSNAWMPQQHMPTNHPQPQRHGSSTAMSNCYHRPSKWQSKCY